MGSRRFSLAGCVPGRSTDVRMVTQKCPRLGTVLYRFGRLHNRFGDHDPLVRRSPDHFRWQEFPIGGHLLRTLAGLPTLRGGESPKVAHYRCACVWGAYGKGSGPAESRKIQLTIGGDSFSDPPAFILHLDPSQFA